MSSWTGATTAPSTSARYKAALARQPTYWAFHPYIAANSTSSTREARFQRFIDATRRTDTASPKIWITEAGGIVNSKAFHNRTEVQAQAATLRLINDVVNMSSRISRMYYYVLVGDEPNHNGNPNSFDSGLLHYVDATHASPYPRAMYDDYRAKTNPTNAAP